MSSAEPNSGFGYPEIAAAHNGTVHVLFDCSGVCYKYWDGRGGSQLIRINNDVRVMETNIAIDQQDRVYLVWRQYGDGSIMAVQAVPKP